MRPKDIFLCLGDTSYQENTKRWEWGESGTKSTMRRHSFTVWEFKQEGGVLSYLPSAGNIYVKRVKVYVTLCMATNDPKMP